MIMRHYTKSCFILKYKIQALVEARVLHLNEKKKQVTTNLVPVSTNFVSLQFGKELPKVKVLDGVMVPKVIT